MPVDLKPSRELYPFESRFFDSSAGRVHYVDEGEGRPLLLLHGNPTWSFLYRDVIRALRDRFRCVAPDYPGFGLSERPPGYGYTPAEHADVIAELAKHLGLDDLVIMGQDWGGPIGLSVALTEPERIGGLVLGNTWFWPLDRWINIAFSRLMSSRPMQRAILERNLFVRRLIPMGMARKPTGEEMRHYEAAQPAPEDRKGVAVFPRQLVAAGPWLEELAGAVPKELAAKRVLLVWGMRDIAFHPKAFLPRIRDTFPDHVLVPLPRAKHFIQEDAPQTIADAIIARFG